MAQRLGLIYRVAIGSTARQDAVMADSFVNIQRKAEDGPYGCPCCGFLTLDERGSYEICPVCFWEDDGQDAKMPTGSGAVRTAG
ncbi:CPCC family cysteine-rich protein [Streptomyces sp. NPDC058249]|uniref:CPCC family cysteine-rich protein n=1 Tax=Streptomyces sp. NPDC058249 TaxID=3346403 RepID=UPI0036EE6729